MLKSSQQIIRLLESLDVPCALMVHRNEPSIPFISYSIDTETYVADNQVYVERDFLTVQIVSNKREFALERRMKDLLNSNKIVWSYDTTNYDSNEETFLTQYTVGG